MIAKYPNFSKLDLEFQEELLDFTSRFEPYSDFNFTSLFSWDTSQTTQISMLDGNLIINMSDYISGKPIYSLMGDSVTNQTLRDLLMNTGSLHLVPESVVEKLLNIDGLQITQDRDNDDYIMSANDIAELSQAKFPKKYKLVEKFKIEHPDFTTASIDLEDTTTKQAIINLFNIWRKFNNKDLDETEVELKAITRLLDNLENLPKMYGVGAFDKDRLAAFNIFEVSTHGYGISSFQKAENRDEGIYAFLTQGMAKVLSSLGCRYINFEQDLGILGLRNSKLSYHPVRFLKKYTIMQLD